MQVSLNMTGASLLPPPAVLAAAEPEHTDTLDQRRKPVAQGILQNLDDPVKATPQSIVQAQINQTDEDAQTAAARQKSILGMMPAAPSEMTKLMSALTAATSAEAIADIKLNARPN